MALTDRKDLDETTVKNMTSSEILVLVSKHELGCRLIGTDMLSDVRNEVWDLYARKYKLGKYAENERIRVVGVADTDLPEAYFLNAGWPVLNDIVRAHDLGTVPQMGSLMQARAHVWKVYEAKYHKPREGGFEQLAEGLRAAFAPQKPMVALWVVYRNGDLDFITHDPHTISEFVMDGAGEFKIVKKLVPAEELK